MIMPKPRLLVLDGEGVVFNSPIKQFLQRFSSDNQLDYAIVEQRWEEKYRQLAWTGNIDDPELWCGLANTRVDAIRTSATLSTAYSPGPAAPHVIRWSQAVPVWLLSNHRSNWIIPKLQQFGIVDAFQRLLISDTTGFVKPDSAAFRQLLSDGLKPQDILFVDDQEKNLETARKHGMRTIHADHKRPWLQEIEQALGSASVSHGSDTCFPVRPGSGQISEP